MWKLVFGPWKVSTTKIIRTFLRVNLYFTCDLHRKYTLVLCFHRKYTLIHLYFLWKMAHLSFMWKFLATLGGGTDVGGGRYHQNFF